MLRELALPHPAAFIEPCLPRPARQPPEGRGWIHEIKHDGFRIMARRADGRVQLLTRKGNDFSRRFPQIVAVLTVLPVRSSQGRRLFCRFSDQTPALKCVMTDNLHRTCPHCGGKNTSYFIGIEGSCGLRPSTRPRTDWFFLLAATPTGTSAPICRNRSQPSRTTTMTRAVTP